MSEGFFDRWSRRKQQVRTGEVPEDVVVPGPIPDVVRGGEVPTVVEAAGPHPGLPPEGEGEGKKSGEAAPLTLADTEALTIASDFKPFLARDVAPEVKNAAFKKLFADPHFNVMDRLDIYIDDYSIASPLPESVLRQMASARFLKLFDEEPEETAESEKPQGTPGDDGLLDVAKSEGSGEVPEVPSPPVADAQPASQETDDHHADLRLQPDDAPRAEDARDGTG